MPGERENDPNLESELRQTAGREWAEEAAEDESLTELMRRRRLGLGEQARDSLTAGARATCEVANLAFAGDLVYAGTDFAVIDRGDDLVAILLDAGIWRFELEDGKAVHQTDQALSMKGHLGELAANGEQVRLLAADGRNRVGSISLVATDHIEVDDGGTRWLVPLSQLVAVIRARPRF